GQAAQLRQNRLYIGARFGVFFAGPGMHLPDSIASRRVSCARGLSFSPRLFNGYSRQSLMADITIIFTIGCKEFFPTVKVAWGRTAAIFGRGLDRMANGSHVTDDSKLQGAKHSSVRAARKPDRSWT